MRRAKGESCRTQTFWLRFDCGGGGISVCNDVFITLGHGVLRPGSPAAHPKVVWRAECGARFFVLFAVSIKLRAPSDLVCVQAMVRGFN